jgi:cell wall-associated protease
LSFVGTGHQILGRNIIDLTSYVDRYTYIQLFDSNNEEIFRSYTSGSSNNPAKLQKEVDLDAGTYFIKIYDGEDYSVHSGKYSLKISAPFLLPTLSVSPVADNATTVKGKTAANQEVVLKVSGKEYKKKSDAKGTFTISIPKQKAGTKISLSVTNKYGTKTTTTAVVDKTPPAAPSVSKITSKTKIITGKAEATSTVYVYSGNKYIGKAKVGTDGKYKVNIASQKQGITLKIYAQDKFGNKSTGKMVKVQ